MCFTFFDDFYTGPFHGFLNAKDYWEKAAVLTHLPNISLPCLLVNAENEHLKIWEQNGWTQSISDLKTRKSKLEIEKEALKIKKE